MSCAITNSGETFLEGSLRVCSTRLAHEDVVNLHSDIHGQSTQSESGVDPLVLMHGVFGSRSTLGVVAKEVAQMNQIEVVVFKCSLSPMLSSRVKCTFFQPRVSSVYENFEKIQQIHSALINLILLAAVTQ